MGTREWPLPRLYELLLGKERDRWPPEARLIEAAHNGDVREIKKIAKELDVQGHGIPLTVANTTYMGMNALHAAGGLGKLPVYQCLVEEVKMDVDIPDTAQEFTPVVHAVTNGHLPAVRYLVDHGADVHQQRENITLLHAAAVHGYSEIVKFLLSRGADVDAISDLGTPLSIATLRGFASIVKILLEHNADPNNNKAICKFVPLSMALQESSVSCVKLLIQGGANVSGDSTLDYLLVKAAEKGLTEAIKCLLEAGANPNVSDTFDRLPIEWAAEYGTREDVEILFPFTSPISTVANWSVDGIISHVKMETKQLEDGNFVKKRMSDLKQQADEAFKKQDYLNASVLYTQYTIQMNAWEADEASRAEQHQQQAEQHQQQAEQSSTNSPAARQSNTSSWREEERASSSRRLVQVRSRRRRSFRSARRGQRREEGPAARGARGAGGARGTRSRRREEGTTGEERKEN